MLSDKAIRNCYSRLNADTKSALHRSAHAHLPPAERAAVDKLAATLAAGGVGRKPVKGFGMQGAVEFIGKLGVALTETEES